MPHRLNGAEKRQRAPEAFASGALNLSDNNDEKFQNLRSDTLSFFIRYGMSVLFCVRRKFTYIFFVSLVEV